MINSYVIRFVTFGWLFYYSFDKCLGDRKICQLTTSLFSPIYWCIEQLHRHVWAPLELKGMITHNPCTDFSLGIQALSIYIALFVHKQQNRNWSFIQHCNTAVTQSTLYVALRRLSTHTAARKHLWVKWSDPLFSKFPCGLWSKIWQVLAYKIGPQIGIIFWLNHPSTHPPISHALTT